MIVQHFLVKKSYFLPQNLSLFSLLGQHQVQRVLLVLINFVIVNRFCDFPLRSVLLRSKLFLFLKKFVIRSSPLLLCLLSFL